MSLPPNMPAVAAPRIPTPRPAPELFGRAELLKNLVALTRARTPLGLYGLPGAGKTALALALVNDFLVAASFPAGRAWIEAGPDANAFQLLGKTLIAFGAPANELTDVDSRAAALRTLLREHPALLILDDVWRVEQAQLIVEACQHPAGVVVTMRTWQLAHDLKLATEAVPPLEPDAALQMLRSGGRYADEYSDAVRAIAADPAGAATLAERLGRLPLALHVATRTLNQVAHAEGAANAVAAVQADLTQQLLDWPAAAARLGIKETEPSLGAVIALSYDRLPPAATAAFCQLY